MFSRRHKQTTFSDAGFLGILRVNLKVCPKISRSIYYKTKTAEWTANSVYPDQMLNSVVSNLGTICSDQFVQLLDKYGIHWNLQELLAARLNINPCPAEPGYTLPLQTV